LIGESGDSFDDVLFRGWLAWGDEACGWFARGFRPVARGFSREAIGIKESFPPGRGAESAIAFLHFVFLSGSSLQDDRLEQDFTNDPVLVNLVRVQIAVR
jgi:hypothetical protein